MLTIWIVIKAVYVTKVRFCSFKCFLTVKHFIGNRSFSFFTFHMFSVSLYWILIWKHQIKNWVFDRSKIRQAQNHLASISFISVRFHFNANENQNVIAKRKKNANIFWLPICISLINSKWKETICSKQIESIPSKYSAMEQ